MNKYAVELVWNSANGNPFERTTALLYVTCKPYQLKSRAESLAELYSAHSYLI